MQQLLASKEALVSQGAKQALAAATVAASAELAAMRSTLQVLSSHLDALQAHPTALASTGAPYTLDPTPVVTFLHSFVICSQHAASPAMEQIDQSEVCKHTGYIYWLIHWLSCRHGQVICI